MIFSAVVVGDRVVLLAELAAEEDERIRGGDHAGLFGY
jgi:hypothetical protein